jgi:16S rRNA (cytidine1402-2'-O)-methyltransferase
MASKPGKIILIPNFLGNENLGFIGNQDLDTIYKLSEFVVESEKSARSYLKAIQHPVHQNEFKFHLMDKRMRESEIPGFFSNCLNGKDVGLLSDAGTPCIADPGAKMVDFAHRKGIQVKPIGGLNSMLLALSASGFNGQNFHFHGYIPFEKTDRNNSFNNLRTELSKGISQIFMETPYRNKQLLTEILERFPESQLLLIASNLTCDDERIDRRTLKQWKVDNEYLHKIPAVFVMGSAR